MNYRRGLQRVYAVLSATWAIAVLFAVLSGHWQPWERFQIAETEIAPTSVEFDPSELRPVPDVSPEEFLKQNPRKTAKLADILPDPSTWRRIAWTASAASLPPIVGYSILFLVFPWVYRGFA